MKQDEEQNKKTQKKKNNKICYVHKKIYLLNMYFYQNIESS